MQNSTKHLSTKFDKYGYVFLRKAISIKKLKKLEKKLFLIYSKFLSVNINSKNFSNIIHNFEKNKRYETLYSAYKKFIKSNEFKDIATLIQKLSRKIYCKKAKLLKTGVTIGLNNSSRTAYKWHQEKSYYNNFTTLHYQFPILNKCFKNNGTMSFLAKSHKSGFIKETRNIKKGKSHINSYVPKNISILKKKYKIKYAQMDLRDIVMFNENIIHRSNPNLTNKIRLAGIIRLKCKN